MEYVIDAYHEEKLVATIRYSTVRYFSTNIYSLLKCYDKMDNGYHYINYRQISQLLRNRTMDEKEQQFFKKLDGYDVIELVFHSYYNE